MQSGMVRKEKETELAKLFSMKQFIKLCYLENIHTLPDVVVRKPVHVAGYFIGCGQTQQPILLLQMPVGLLL